MPQVKGPKKPPPPPPKPWGGAGGDANILGAPIDGKKKGKADSEGEGPAWARKVARGEQQERGERCYMTVTSRLHDCYMIVA